MEGMVGVEGMSALVKILHVLLLHLEDVEVARILLHLEDADPHLTPILELPQRAARRCGGLPHLHLLLPRRRLSLHEEASVDHRRASRTAFLAAGSAGGSAIAARR